MKLKIAFVFLLLAGGFTFFVFKGGYFFSDKLSGAEPKANVSSLDMIQKLSELSLVNYDAKALKISSDDLAAEKVIVHFWASWCPPCIGEVPELIEYSKLNPEMKFIIVSMDYDIKDIAKFMKSFPEFNSEKYIRVWDQDKKIANLLTVDRLPMTVVFKKATPEPLVYKGVVPWKSIKL